MNPDDLDYTNSKGGIRVLITGGAGFIGSHISEFVSKNCAECTEIVVLDNFRSGKRSNLQGISKVKIVEGSITDRAAVARVMRGITYVFHLAAMVSVAESMDAAIECNKINTEGTLIVLEEAAKAKVKKLVFSSSAALYGDDPTVPKVEDMKPRCLSPYAQTKLDGEFYVQLFHNTGKLRGTVLRYFNVFGERQDPKSQYAAAIPQFIDRAVKRQPLHIYGDGEQTRDFVYVRDIAMANWWAATHDISGVFNVGYGASVTINAIARQIIDICSTESGQSAGKRYDIQYETERPGDVRHSMASVDRLKATGWRPSYRFEDALQSTVNWFLKQSKVSRL